jgi:translation elongation factor EF-Ts
VREPKTTVEQVLANAGVTVTKFAHFEVGAA